ncbi:SDR family NAD(P)-dependent oxidoreductase, partial [Micromonospora sp. DT201]|uniref:SDR family NAD(P)-dependent oxidoreductase n=1 Tax=Micromonospora sp. DT201 TaxID=3393442 RepID=UPI003CE9CB16
ETPLVLPEHGDVHLQVTVSEPDHTGIRPFAVHSRPDRDDASWTRHASGGLAPRSVHSTAELTAWPPADATPLSLEDGYDRLRDRGYEYGPVFQGLRAAWQAGADLYAEVRLPDGVDPGGFTLHPALLDAALHVIGLTGPATPDCLLPFAWQNVTVHAAGADALRVHVRRTGTGSVALTIADATGGLVAVADSLTLRPVTTDQLRGPAAGALYGLNWTALPGTPPPGVTPAFELYEPAAGSDPIVRAITANALARAQRWLAADRPGDNRLVFVTRGAVATEPQQNANPVQAAVWGLIRTAQSEHPGHFVLVDIDSETGDEDVEAAVAGVLAYAEDQVAIRAGRAHVPRLVPLDTPQALPEEAWRFDVSGQGSLDRLAVVTGPETESPLEPGQVRIAVRAAGVNFRDVVMALGMVPDQHIMGCEAAGVVLAVGPGVTGFDAGDRVMGIVGGSFGPIAVADHRLLAEVPAGWTFAEAASVPIAFLTAWYGLHEVGKLRAGESVLVHAAAGGVGMAAVQLARDAGAEVFATASPAKWDALRALGLDDAHLASSRTLAFRDAFRRVDVVLNSLTREFVDASLELLGAGGRFVEMGKTDIRPAANVMAAFPGLTYAVFDLLSVDPGRIQQMFAQLLATFRRGAVRPLPMTTWDIRRAPDALRFMSQARHVGKVVLTLPRRLDPDGTVVITGGTGELGGLLARHLAGAHGVQHLVLAGRRGLAAPGAADLVRELAALGAEATVVTCDAADRSALAALLANLPGGRRLDGVVHAAGVLDDGVLESLDPDRLDRVLRPKADGAANLDALTADQDLALFALFSSAVGTFGGAGQANYAAANVFLDALAQQRRARGLPGLSIAWGLWDQRSDLTRHLGDADVRRMSRSGMAPLSSSDGLALFDAASRCDAALVVPTRLDTAAMRTPAQVPPLLRDIVRTPHRRVAARSAAGPDDSIQGLTVRLSAAAPAEHDRILADLVVQHTAAVLGHRGSRVISAERSFKELGFDSLTAVELRNRLNAATGLRLRTTVVFDRPTPRALAEQIRTELLGDTTPAVPEPSAALAAVDRDIDRLQAALSALNPDGPARTDIAVRLRSLVAAWDTGNDDEEGLSSASAEEMFALLDRELGTS